MPKRFYVEESDFSVLGPQDWIHILSDPDLEFLGYGAEEIEETRESVLSELRKGNNLVLHHLWKRISDKSEFLDEDEDEEAYEFGEYDE
jgi:hypothetical protein